MGEAPVPQKGLDAISVKKIMTATVIALVVIGLILGGIAIAYIDDPKPAVTDKRSVCKYGFEFIPRTDRQLISESGGGIPCTEKQHDRNPQQAQSSGVGS